MVNFGEKVTVISFFVRSKIWVALAALVMSLESGCLLQDDLQWFNALQIFFIALVGYLFLDHAHIGSRKPIVYFALTGTVFCFLIKPDQNYLLLLLSATIVATYSLDWFPESKRKLKVLEWRKIPIVKNMVIAICWTILTIGLNLNYSDWFEVNVYSFAIVQFLLVFSLSIAEDIIDQPLDRFKTIPSMLGTRMSKFLAFSIAALAMFFYFLNTQDEKIQWSILIVTISLALVIALISPNKKRDLQSFAIDGIIILKSCLICFWC